MLMAALVAVVVAALALPAMAHSRFHNKNQWNNNPWANSWWNPNNNWGGHQGKNSWWNPNNNNNDLPVVSQTNEQEVQSGNSSQTFNVSGGGNNSNSCQGIQGISNTGNAVNSTSVLQDGSEGNVWVGNNGNFEISPSQSTVCNQRVNQAATASG
jgi:hypothetical protein